VAFADTGRATLTGSRGRCAPLGTAPPTTSRFSAPPGTLLAATGEQCVGQLSTRLQRLPRRAPASSNAAYEAFPSFPLVHVVAADGPQQVPCYRRVCPTQSVVRPRLSLVRLYRLMARTPRAKVCASPFHAVHVPSRACRARDACAACTLPGAHGGVALWDKNGHRGVLASMPGCTQLQHPHRVAVSPCGWKESDHATQCPPTPRRAAATLRTATGRN
jgi:hypothetical protein